MGKKQELKDASENMYLSYEEIKTLLYDRRSDATLTVGQVNEIKRRIDSGESYRSVSKDFDKSYQYLNELVNWLEDNTND